MNDQYRRAISKTKESLVFWIVLLFPLLFVSSSLQAQSILSVRYSPESTDFLGHLKYFSKFDFEYSKIFYQDDRYSYNPSIRLSILNLHLRNHSGYTDRYGVPPGQRFVAFGIVPASFSERLPNLPVYVDEGLGVGYFPKRFPNKNGRNFNLIIEAGFHVTVKQVLLIGYRYSHVSNAWTGRVNPGMDSNMFSIGVIIP